MTVSHPLPAQRPPIVSARSPSARLALLAIGVLLLSLSSYVAIPMAPVPITMQTLAVTLVGALYGWRMGTVSVAVWLALGAAGLPVLADGGSGLQKFMGPTAGYLFAFPLAAALAGGLVQRGWDGGRLGLAFAAMLAATALCLLFGGAWLAVTIGWEKALMKGVAPFVPGGVIKSLAAALVLKVVHAHGYGRAPYGGADSA
ncbi:biotin transporter BioY [Bordetella genomosp. 13]|uniref:Biotin transporter n=1 Tax=Bordetella genomosp. 13 TaxID=463040 RepID=A0A1W6ZCT5_9BORD|nr:biotin transporter BioY [Bordetella genomosp. 13]